MRRCDGKVVDSKISRAFNFRSVKYRTAIPYQAFMKTSRDCRKLFLICFKRKKESSNDLKLR